MIEITLDEMLQEVQAQEALIKEPVEVTQMIAMASMEVVEAAQSGKVTIFTDYDADGICSAYIMEKSLKAVNPDCEVTVKCNDRRDAYGLSPDIQGNGESRYIICDMGSNQLALARERLGEDVIIFDHHLIEDDDVRAAFASLEPSTHSNCLCNPHALHKDDSENAQYCATGLAYRAYQEIGRLCKIFEKPFHTDPKQDNTIAVMACIGTATDMVDVMDLNSHNRQILKDGLRRIDNADEQNLDFVIGNMLARCKVSDQITAHQLAFNVGAFLNSASRMSEIADENGAQKMYDAITGDERLSSTYRALDALMKQNDERKKYISELTSDDSYKAFIESHRFGQEANDNIGIYQLPDDVPAAFAGLVAGKLAEATDKAIICVTYSNARGTFTGSGRNTASNETSLKSFLDNAVDMYNGKKSVDDEKIHIKYGGHNDAIGISSLNDVEQLWDVIHEAKDNMLAKDSSRKNMLSITPAELAAPQTLAKLQMLEPTGVGLQVPCAVIRGTETYRDKLFKSGRDDWKTLRVSDPSTKTSIDIADWAYSPKSYPQTGKKKNEIALVASLGIGDYKGTHLELTAKPDRAFLKERIKEVELMQNPPPKNAVNRED